MACVPLLLDFFVDLGVVVGIGVLRIGESFDEVEIFSIIPLQYIVELVSF